MNDKAIEKLRNVINTNYDDKRFPSSYLSIHTTERHIQIYMLVKEYVELYEDMKYASTATVKAFIHKRMSEIERELMRFWIATEDEMVVPKKKA